MLTYDDVMAHSATLERDCRVGRFEDCGVQIAELVGRFIHTFGENNKCNEDGKLNENILGN